MTERNNAPGLPEDVMMTYRLINELIDTLAVVCSDLDDEDLDALENLRAGYTAFLTRCGPELVNHELHSKHAEFARNTMRALQQIADPSRDARINRSIADDINYVTRGLAELEEFLRRQF